MATTKTGMYRRTSSNQVNSGYEDIYRWYDKKPYLDPTIDRACLCNLPDGEVMRNARRVQDATVIGASEPEYFHRMELRCLSYAAIRTNEVLEIPHYQPQLPDVSTFVLLRAGSSALPQG